MRKLTVNHTPTLPTRGNKTAASLRTRIAALLTLSAALLAATTLGGATPASAEDAPPAPAPPRITVKYRNSGAYISNFCLDNSKPAQCHNIFPSAGAPILELKQVVFEDGGKAKIDVCAILGRCAKLEVSITPDTKELCFESTGTTFIDFDLFQADCATRNRIAG